MLVTGESGTGKELISKHIHQLSPRSNNNFVALNCAALAESIIESELFGVERGVATGVEKRVGKFEHSNKGTLFLDEIGDMSLSLQAKILRVLEDGIFTRVGSNEYISVDIRVIAATNKDLTSEIKKGNFREDLYYRLNGINIFLPPLRDISEDIPLLINHFLTLFSKELNCKPFSVTDEAVNYLSKYSWRGNIRELRNEIRKAAAICNNNIINIDNISLNIRNNTSRKSSNHKLNINSGKNLKEMVSKVEYNMIKQALIETNWNKVKASKLLGISRQGLLQKMKRYEFNEKNTELYDGAKYKIKNQTFVGRDAEIEIILNIIQSENFENRVVFLHGIGGIGKTFLVDIVSQLIKNDANIIKIDCREVEPTAVGFLNNLAEKIGLETEEVFLNDIIRELSLLNQKKVIVLDTYETYGLLDTWLRNEFIPKLPNNTVVLIVGRQPPKTAWYKDSKYSFLFNEIELKELSKEDSYKFLALKGYQDKDFLNLYRFTHGHPLALELATRSWSNLSIKNQQKSFNDVIFLLTKEFLLGMDPTLRNSIESISVVRRFNDPILRSLILNDYESQILDQIVELPFIDINNYGYIIHDLVRDSIAKYLSIKDPDLYRTLKQRAWEYLIDSAKDKSGTSLWQYTADILYLTDNQVVKEAFFPKGYLDLVVEPASESDGNFVLEIVKDNDGIENMKIIKTWWENFPNTFKVIRNPDSEIVSFFILCEPDEIDITKIANDPITNFWFRHFETHPVKEDEKILILRRWLAKNYGESPSPCQAACWLDKSRSYMELRPKLRRLYSTVKDVDTYAPIVSPMGFTVIEDSNINIDGDDFFSVMLDFGPESVDGWLTKLVGCELRY